MKPLKIGAYVRVSTEEQALIADGSLENQKYRIRSFVDLKSLQKQDWGDIVEFFVDNGYSGRIPDVPPFNE